MCREAASEGEVGERGGERGRMWATGLRKVEFEVRHCQGSRTEEVKE